jgi:ankyrin repeat protein
VAAVETLLDHGADPEIADFEGYTALMHAVKSKHLPTVQLLLKYGADISRRDAYGGTVLHHASHAKENADLIRALINAHADVNAIDYDGDTALQYAVRQNHTKNARCLLEFGADHNIANVEGETPMFMAIYHQAEDILRMLVVRGVDLNIVNSGRQTVLHAVACEGTANAMRALMETHMGEVDVLAKDSDGRTCLDYFASRHSSDPDIASAFTEMIASMKHGATGTRRPSLETLEESVYFEDALQWQTESQTLSPA